MHEAADHLRAEELVALSAELARAPGADGVARTLACRLVHLLDVADVDVWRMAGTQLQCVASCERGGFDDEVVGTVLDLARAGSASWAIEHGEPIVIEGVDDPRLSDVERTAFREYGFVSSLSVPLVAEDVVVGLVELYDDRARDWSACTSGVGLIAQMAAGIFRAALALEEAQAANASLQTLVDAAVEIGSSLDLDVVLHNIALRMCAASGAPACELFGVRGNGVVGLTSVVDGELQEAEVGRIWDGRKYYVRSDEAIHPRLIEIPDIEAEVEASPEEVAEWLRCGWRSGVVIPLLAQGKVVGRAFVYDRVPRRWTGLEMLRGLAQIAAQALSNASLHQEVREAAEHQRLANEVSLQLMSRLSVDEATAAAAGRLREMIGAADCDVWQLKGGELRCLLSINDGHPDGMWTGLRVPAAEWPTWVRVIESREPALIDDRWAGALTERERAWLADAGIGSALVLPLAGRAGFRGTLEFYSGAGRRRFTADDVEAVAPYATAVTLALENARLFEDLQTRRWEAELINRLARETSASLDLTEMAGAALDGLAATVPYDRAGVAVAGTDGKLRVLVTRPKGGLPLEGLTLASVDESLLAGLLNDDVVRLRLPAEVHRLGDVDLPAELREVVVVLLATAGEPIGVVVLAAEAEGSLAGVDVPLLRRFGEHLSLAFRNARLYEQLRQRHAANLATLDAALGTKDAYRIGHPTRVGAYAILLGRRLGWPESLLEEVAIGAALHDIGLLGVSSRLLGKPGRLLEHEWDLIRQHPQLSAEIVRPLCSSSVASGVLHHHERWDGGGYPAGLSGDAIPEVARALGIADAYDAMSMHRPYREALDYAGARQELLACAGKQFDPALIDEFLAVLDDLQERKRAATAVALEATLDIDAQEHARLRARHDELTSAYRSIQDALRRVRDRHPGVENLSTSALRGGRVVYVVDALEDASRRSELGATTPVDEELQEWLTTGDPGRCVLWSWDGRPYICGYARLCDGHGRVEAVVAADVPLTDIPLIGDAADVSAVPGFDSRLRFATVRLTKAEVDAMTDGLTGLVNHRHFHERLGEEAAHAGVTGQPLALLFIDIDGFKTYNDRFGHQAGDEALRLVARAVLSSVRRSDVAARYGGEEFAVLLPGVDVAGAVGIAERMRAEVARLFADEGHPDHRLSISVGVATMPDHAHAKDDLLERADLAMYAAKRCGKDRVFVFGTADPS